MGVATIDHLDAEGIAPSIKSQFEWNAVRQLLAAGGKLAGRCSRERNAYLGRMLAKRNVTRAVLGIAALAVVYLSVAPMIDGFAIMTGWIGR